MHVSEDSSAADTDDCRPHLYAARERRRRVPGPSERDRQGGRARSDAEAQPGVRDEVRDAGLQQAGQHHGPAARSPRTDPHPPDRQAAAALLDQPHRPTLHLRRGHPMFSYYAPAPLCYRALSDDARLTSV